MAQPQFEHNAFRGQPHPSSRSDAVSPTLKAGDPEMATFLESLYARNLPEAEESDQIRRFVRVRQQRNAA
jgi:hypothetical protein